MTLNIGDTYNYLTIIDFTKELYGTQGKRRKVICKCECGTICTILPSKLKNGYTKSCGCFRKNQLNRTTHGMSDTPIYKVWSGIKRRCDENITDKRTQVYRDKKIKVCKEWKDDFLCFYNWAIANGYKKGLHLDRIDTNDDYKPSNCQFINASENTAKVKQDRNTKLQLIERIEYLENILIINKIKF